jgi:hypothetical protein
MNVVSGVIENENVSLAGDRLARQRTSTAAKIIQGQSDYLYV